MDSVHHGKDSVRKVFIFSEIIVSAVRLFSFDLLNLYSFHTESFI